MDEVILRIVAAALTACLLCLSRFKMLGAMQQSGYKNGGFLRWLLRKDNLQFKRLSVLALCLVLLSTVRAPFVLPLVGREVCLEGADEAHGQSPSAARRILAADG